MIQRDKVQGVLPNVPHRPKAKFKITATDILDPMQVALQHNAVIDDNSPGTWENPTSRGRRMRFPVVNGQMFPRGASLYTISCDEGLDLAMEKVAGPFLPNVTRLDVYRRYHVDVPHSFPTSGSSFADGTYLYYVSMNRMGQFKLARSYLGILNKIRNLYAVKMRKMPQAFDLRLSCFDDFVRKHLKAVSAWAFPRVFSDGPAYMFLMHGDMLGGHAPWTKDQILADITNWTSGKDQCNLELLLPYMGRIFDLWPKDSHKDHKLGFREFCNDPLRWGTSGGAKRVTIGEEQYRSKWAWAWSRLIKDGKYVDVDLYAEACAEDNTCVVALKEEEKKTREIITTPMASYLRQSYLAYRWGNLPGDTPLSQPRWLGDFQSTEYAWYGCADADRFDHSVSKDMVEYVLTRLGSIDAECAAVAQEEINSLQGLKVKWNDVTWDYRGGLLSGWRLTSMIGTIASLAIGHFIIDDLGLVGARVIAMGDDIMIASPGLTATRDQLYESYAKTGFKVNMAKTTVGRTGEFLRQTYSPRGILGYPANGLSAIIFSPPWLARYQLEKEQEVSKSWLTFYSRLLPHSLETQSLTTFFRKRISEAVKTMGNIRGSLQNWLNTPISAGGGGPIEWSNPKEWSSIVLDFPDTDTAPSFLSLFGITASSMKDTIHRSKRIQRQDLMSIRHDCSQLHRLGPELVVRIPDFVNKTRALLSWFLDKTVSGVSSLEGALQVKLPRSLHLARKLEVVKFVLGIERSATGFCSVQTTVAATGRYQAKMASLTRVAASNRRLFNAKNISAVATLYASQLFTHVPFVSGTW